MRLGSSVKKVRKRLGIKQYDLAAKVGISVSYLSLIENGERDPGLGIISRICVGMGVSEVVLLWESIEEEDIDPYKRELFRTLKPTIDNMLGI